MTVTYLIEGDGNDWEVVIGLEVHAQIVSDAKLFSGAPTAFGAEPNTQVSLVDAAMPGMLPVVNKVCIEQAVRTGLGLNAKINLHSVFERKNYFYPDLPFGYQISQYQHPIVGEGVVTLDLPDGGVREVGIERLHMEQDAGKSLHDQDPKRTYVDLNRAGVALMEIVSKPDLRSPEEVGAYLRKLRSILRYLGTCDGNMEQGSLRCDVNVSVRPAGSGELRTRTEIKNVNSVRFAMQAVEFEAGRQVEVYDGGGEVDQETRLFDPSNGETRSMRSKEEAHDYRYFPDPDLLPVELTEEEVDRIRAGLPELPDAKKRRFIDEYGISAEDAGVLVAERETAAFFEEVAEGRDPKLAANWVIHELFAVLNKEGKGIAAYARLFGRPRKAGGSDLGRHHLGPHRQGCVRDHDRRRRRSGGHRRGEGPRPDHRHGCHRGRGRQGDRRQPGPGAGIQGRQPEGRRLVRRPGDEGHGRQSQPQNGK